MRKDYERYREVMRTILDVLERCFDKPNCVIHEGDIELMYRSYAVEEANRIFITVKDIDFEFSSFDNAVNFLVGYMGG